MTVPRVPPVSRIVPPSPVVPPPTLSAQGIDPLALPTRVFAPGPDGSATVNGLQISVVSTVLARDRRSATVRLLVRGIVPRLRDPATLHVSVTGESGSTLPATVVIPAVSGQELTLDVRITLPQEGRGDTALRTVDLPVRMVVYTARSGVAFPLNLRRP
ncbi:MULTISPECIES: hypothetical protein [Deinococcus]|uniref:Uncharacterized protein n=1 Tax=Deinococcus rufus TaxID=2136097 RepID=A0ABV7Z4J1_9DEIO|nr:hypothetical protein [Deinococcus sp. AB2017081]WQE96522.1 hypothetical protein U2P90_06385 [Deinococcus sp. AB2017081]